MRPSSSSGSPLSEKPPRPRRRSTCIGCVRRSGRSCTRSHSKGRTPWWASSMSSSRAGCRSPSRFAAPPFGARSGRPPRTRICCARWKPRTSYAPRPSSWRGPGTRPAARIDLDWTVQLSGLADGTSQLVVQAGNSPLDLHQSMLGPFLSVGHALAPLLRAEGRRTGSILRAPIRLAVLGRGAGRLSSLMDPRSVSAEARASRPSVPLGSGGAGGLVDDQPLQWTLEFWCEEQTIRIAQKA
jgi:hypothetical protein